MGHFILVDFFLKLFSHLALVLRGLNQNFRGHFEVFLVSDEVWPTSIVFAMTIFVFSEMRQSEP